MMSNVTVLSDNTDNSFPLNDADESVRMILLIIFCLRGTGMGVVGEATESYFFHVGGLF